MRPTRVGKLRVALLGGLVVAAYFVAPASVPAGGRSGPEDHQNPIEKSSGQLIVKSISTSPPESAKRGKTVPFPQVHNLIGGAVKAADGLRGDGVRRLNPRHWCEGALRWEVRCAV